MLVISGRLPAEAGALVLRALEAGMQDIDGDGEAVGTGASAEAPGHVPPESSEDASAEAPRPVDWRPSPELYDGWGAEDSFGATRVFSAPRLWGRFRHFEERTQGSPDFKLVEYMAVFSH